MSPIDRSWAREAPRDQEESAFTPILRRLLHRQTGVIAVCFVDGEGECIDYCAALPPFDAKVIGAHLLFVASQMSDRMRALGAGQSWMLHVHAETRDLVVRRVGDGYALVVAIKPDAMTQRLLGGMEHAAGELRREAGIPASAWESLSDSVRVETRTAVGWPYAPAAFVGEAGERVEIDDVMGRWTEGSGPRTRVCFRVRTVTGMELTLVHDRALDRWERLGEGQ